MPQFRWGDRGLVRGRISDLLREIVRFSTGLRLAFDVDRVPNPASAFPRLRRCIPGGCGDCRLQRLGLAGTCLQDF